MIVIFTFSNRVRFHLKDFNIFIRNKYSAIITYNSDLDPDYKKALIFNDRKIYTDAMVIIK
jgi:hypothetical protein